MVDIGRVLLMHSKWKAALPNIQPFYAVKCNEDPMLLKTLAALGTGFDCASKVNKPAVICSLVLCILCSFFQGCDHILS